MQATLSSTVFKVFAAATLACISACAAPAPVTVVRVVAISDTEVRVATGFVIEGGEVATSSIPLRTALKLEVATLDGRTHPVRGIVAVRPQLSTALLDVNWQGQPPKPARLGGETGAAVTLIHAGSRNSAPADHRVECFIRNSHHDSLQLEAINPAFTPGCLGAPVIARQGNVVGMVYSHNAGVQAGASPPQFGRYNAIRAEQIVAIESGPLLSLRQVHEAGLLDDPSASTPPHP